MTEPTKTKPGAGRRRASENVTTLVSGNGQKHITAEECSAGGKAVLREC